MRGARGAHPSSLVLLVLLSGCGSPAQRFMQRMDSLPPEERVPNWETTRALMTRPAPLVGSLAPDFTLQTPDGTQAITRSAFQGGRPLVLVFGSFT